MVVIMYYVIGVSINGSNNVLCNSTLVNGILNVCGSATLNNVTTLYSSVNTTGNIIGSGTASTNLYYNAITNKPDLTVFATYSNLNSLSSTASLSISNLNSTSTSFLIQ